MLDDNKKQEIADRIWNIMVEHDANRFQFIPMYLRSLKITDDKFIYAMVLTNLSSGQYENVMKFTVSELTKKGYNVPDYLIEKYQEEIKPFI